MSRRVITDSIKQQLLVRQFGCCNNRPDKSIQEIERLGLNIPGKGPYRCPLWKLTGDQQGRFDESGYEADHIIEHALSHDDTIENLQLICPCCHSVKTKLFTRQPRSSAPLTAQERCRGVRSMDEEREIFDSVPRGTKRARYESMETEFGIISEMDYLRKLK
jgi:hypothetical protein